MDLLNAKLLINEKIKFFLFHVSMLSHGIMWFQVLNGELPGGFVKKLYFKISVNIYLFKFNNRNTWKRCEICSNLTIKISERRHWCCSGVLINFEHIYTFSSVSVVDFEQVNVTRVMHERVKIFHVKSFLVRCLF